MDSLYSREEKKAYQFEQIEKLVEDQNGLVKTSQITGMGIDYRRILHFVEEGMLKRVKSGYYTTRYWDGSEEDLIAEMFPDGVLTMESALYYYGYLSKKPYGWSIAVSKNISKSRFKLDYPIAIPYYSEPQVLELGKTQIAIGDKEMGIYTKDRLICDCLKYQEKMSREDFKKGVLSYLNDDSKDVAALMAFARERRVLKKVQTMIGIWL